MTQSLSSLTEQLLAAAKQAGADTADAIAVDGTSLTIGVQSGKLEQADRAEGIDLGVRVFVGQRQASVSSSDTKPTTLKDMAERAVAMAREAPEDPYAGLADASQLATDLATERLELADPAAEPDPAVLQDDALRAQAAALANNGISQVQSASASYSARNMHLAASNGFSAGYRRTERGVSCVAISGTGTDMERDYDYDARIFQADLRDAADIGRVAAERAVARAKSRKPPTGAYPVLFDERVANSLIGSLLQATNGQTIARGSGWLRDKLGKQVLPKGLSLIEDPHRKRVTGSRLFDGEGLATARRAIIDDGILTGWTTNLSTSRQLNVPNTANAARGTSGAPSPNVSNVTLTEGAHSQAELIAQMGTGLLVTSMIGATINPNTGDYSRGAAGFWIENGEITYPVNECTIAGNLRDMLMSMVPANDARHHVSRVIPSLLIKGLTLAGT